MKTHVRTARGRRAYRAFSLLELMLVMAIMGTLMAIVAWNLLGQGEKAKRTNTIGSMKTIQGQIDTFLLDKSVPPARLEDLVTAKLMAPGALLDGWKTAFFYIPTPNAEPKYQLKSAGPDKKLGTPDDIDVWTMMKE